MSVIFDPTKREAPKPTNQRKTGTFVKVPKVQPTKRNHDRRPPTPASQVNQ